MGQAPDASRLLPALADAALTCAAALPQQTSRLLHQSTEAARAWRSLASAGGGRAALLLVPEQMDETLDDFTQQAEEREGFAAARLRQGLQRISVLESLAMKTEEEMEDVEPQELRLRLAHLERVSQQQREEAAATQAALEQENRQLRRTLADKEDELVMVASKVEQKQAATESAEGELALPPDARRLAAEAAEGGPDDGASLEEAVVRDIRKARLVGVELEELPAGLRRGVAEMRRSLTAAVDRLAKDLYESQAHFVQELLQNADDNSYGECVQPRINLVLRGRPPEASGHPPYFFAANNEKGLTEADVRALCDISRSSKSQATGTTTGYKGVGWKSVFRVTDEPHVLSQGWRFKFSSAGLGMLTPQWLEDSEVSKLPSEVREAHSRGDTVFYLPLSDPSKSVPSIRTEMQTIQTDSAQLLFLRRVTEISLKGDWAAEEESEQFVDAWARIMVAGSQDPRAATTRQRFQQTGSEPPVLLEEITTRFQISSHEDVLVALPKVEEPPPQRVFAFLPVRSVGFRFAIQAPFHLTASRADLHRSPENLRRRNAVAPAFIKACQANSELAAQAVEFLGTEPADHFWLPIRQSLVEALQNLACVVTEDGSTLEPGRCLLRGGLPAARWVPSEVLEEALGLRFVAQSLTADAGRELGIREFGYKELVACISWASGHWLQDLWRAADRRSAAFTDLFQSLVDNILEDPVRLPQVQNLHIFPVTSARSKSLTATLCNEVELSTCTNLHTAPCSAVPKGWQLHLLRFVEPSLEIASRGAKLFQLLGLEAVSEEELEAVAFRKLLFVAKVGAESQAGFDAKTYWCAMAVLRRSYLLGRSAPAPGWASLRGAVALLSDSQQMIPAPQLRLWSFLGIELRLPTSIISNICTIAGIEQIDPGRSPQPFVERAAAPPASLGIVMDPPADEWHLGWEIFLRNVFGCQPMDPFARPVPGGPSLAEGFVEALLRLGDLLASGSFWRKVQGKPTGLAYLADVMMLGQFSEAARLRRGFLRRLAVRSASYDAGRQLVLQDLFVKEVFHGTAGCYLPYMDSLPDDPRVFALLKWCGVSATMDQASLMKALRFVRETQVEDLGLVSELYRLLHERDFVPGSGKMFLVPGKGYLAKEDCAWKPFNVDLLQKCCNLEVLLEHYSRFGMGVRQALTSWVLEKPEHSATQLCEALLQAIDCSRAHPFRPERMAGKVPIHAQTAASQLFPAAKKVVEELVKLCVGEVDPIGGFVRFQPKVGGNKRPETTVFNHFVQHRMIVIPGFDVQCRILTMSEAYWSVDAPLHGTLAEESALEKHYGQGDEREAVYQFFTEVLRVKPILSAADWHQIQLNQAQSRSMTTDDGVDDPIQEGLRLFAAKVPSPPSVPLDLNRALQAAYDRVNHSQPPEEGPESGGSQSSSGNQGPRIWRHVGFLGSHQHSFPLFAANDVQPPLLETSDDEIQLLLQLCRQFGLYPEHLAFAYDPSGLSVGRERMFLDVKYLQRSRLLHAQAGYEAMVSYWSGKFAKLVANRGPVDAEGATLLTNHLLQMVLPNILQGDMQ